MVRPFKGGLGRDVLKLTHTTSSYYREKTKKKNKQTTELRWESTLACSRHGRRRVPMKWLIKIPNGRKDPNHQSSFHTSSIRLFHHQSPLAPSSPHVSSWGGGAGDGLPSPPLFSAFPFFSCNSFWVSSIALTLSRAAATDSLGP